MRTLGILIVAVTVVAGSLSFHAERAFATHQEVYVVDGKTHSIVILDPDTGVHIDTVDLTGVPRAVAFSPDGELAYVLHQAGSVDMIRTDTRRVARTVPAVDGALDAHAAVPSPDRRTLWLAHQTTGISIVDIRSHDVEQIALPAPSTEIVFSPNGRLAYASLPSVQAVAVIDVEKQVLLTTLSLDAQPLKVVPFGPSQSGVTIATSTGVVIWDEDHASPKYLPSPAGVEAAVQANRRGHVLLSLFGGDLVLFDPVEVDFAVLGNSGADQVKAIAAKPDGEVVYLLTRDTGEIVRFHLQSGDIQRWPAPSREPFALGIKSTARACD